MAGNNATEAPQKSLQDIMSGDLFASGKGDLVETLRFMEKHGTPLGQRQVAGIALLRTLQAKSKGKVYDPVIKALTEHAKDVTDPRLFVDVIEKMTLGGFVTGRVRMSKLFEGGGGR